MSSLYWELRERFRHLPIASTAAYAAQILLHAHTGKFRREIIGAVKNAPRGEGVALCVRIRDEAPNLQEFVEYYLAAGISHLYFYEARSADDFHAVLDPFVQEGVATIIESWPHVPISPAAEHDCALRCIGRYAWMGCIDADEFVVVKDNRRIDEFLSSYPRRCPAAAFHWRYYGSNGHISRPAGPVIAEYTRRQADLNTHVKVFVRPERVASCRNSHSWYYRGLFATAVNEKGKRVFGSLSQPPTADYAWINHYHHKSEAEYLAKAKRSSILDTLGMTFSHRTPERGKDYDKNTNAVVDLSAVRYHRALCKRAGCSICTFIGTQTEMRSA
ncbi:MAG: glycosyltransferase family 92 protein [Terracidiphilus sp.]